MGAARRGRQLRRRDAVRLRLHPLAGPIWQATLAYAADGADEALGALADVAAEAPAQVTLAAWIGAARASPFVPEQWHGRPVVMLSAVYVGAAAAGERLVAPLRAAGPFAEDAGEATYLDLQRSADESAAPGFRRCWKAHFLPRSITPLPRRSSSTAYRRPRIAERRVRALRARRRDRRRGARPRSLAARLSGTSWRAPGGQTPPTMRASSESRARRPRRWRRSRGVYANDLGDEGSDRVRAAYGDETYGRLVA